MKFTIGLPIVKAAFLKNTLDSIAAQTLQNYELIIRNNAKTEQDKAAIKNICHEWLNKSNVQYYESEEQLNISENFNKILEKATGDFFFIMSDDDVMMPEYLEEFAVLIAKFPIVNVFHCRVKIVNEQDNLINYTELCPEFETLPDFVFHRVTSKRIHYLSDFVVSTAELKKVGGFKVLPAGWGIDDLAWYLTGSTGIVATQKVLLLYRQIQNNFSFSRKNLLLRFADLDMFTVIVDDIIKSAAFVSNSIYPIDFLLKKNHEKKEKSKLLVLQTFALSSSAFELGQFFIENYKKYNLPKGYTAKLFFKKLTGKKV